MTDTALPPARRPGPRAWAALVAAEGQMVVRDTAGLVIPLGLPLLTLVMHGLGTTGASEPGDAPDPAQAAAIFERYVVPLVLTLVIATIGVVNMPSFLAYYRRTHVLRRLAVTPANPGMILAAQVVVSVLQSAVGIALGVAAATAWFGVGAPARPGAALAVLGLAAAAMYALGMLVAAVAPSGNAAVAIGLTVFFALGATGGMFGPVSNLPRPVAAVGEALPFGAAVDAVGRAWAGLPQDPANLLALAAAVLVCGAVAVKAFRWN
ncbi:ABC transporter permease [Glycomyces paridis]|uniref:ABC transporter permease n=1 Tax=Glycomyces paridis TaxID=2126555 RepID=A0A4S8P0I3_9ACTN|nr:ABC transporter permease [Glycomyces paridis]THV23510.1 ABC transporter permease [Glycomyces paridis]